MTKSRENILSQFKRRWMRQELLKLSLLAIAPAIFLFLITSSLFYAVAVFCIIMSILLLLYKPFGLDKEKVSRYLDHQLPELEHSSWLLLKPTNQLSSLARLQEDRLNKKIQLTVARTSPPTRFNLAIILLFVFLALGFLGKQLEVMSFFDSSPASPGEAESIVFQPVDSLSPKTNRPKITSQKLIINYPNYTGLASKATNEMNIKALEGSKLTWILSFDTIVNKVAINSSGTIHPMQLKAETYQIDLELQTSGFYNFEFWDSSGAQYLSELYALEKIMDYGPEISIRDVDEFQSFEFFEEKIVNVKAKITDDFGIANAAIIATLSSGEGESVQFREETMEFDQSLEPGSSNVELSKGIDLDKLKMKPGDELYFYVEASDLKKPTPNISRSETFFVVIKDTLEDGFAVEGTMGADLMPDYFRSQRQLIIDTKKLINEKPELSESDFKFRSNELGFDQKALRLKYGQFMGDEDNSGLELSTTGMGEDEVNDGTEKEDPLAAYTHDHDSEEHQHEGQLDIKDEDEENENPLHDYIHDHSDPEAATLFEKSLKLKLREAMAEMWDAELQLRLYEPAKSLPYQQRALKIIQEIKNSTRIYVHRIGFDPPPIKEETRLTGELKDIGNYRKQKDFENDTGYLAIKRSISILEELINRKRPITEGEKNVFENAANKLAGLAIEEPGRYLTALQNLKWLTEGLVKSKNNLIETQKTLFNSVKKSEHEPGRFSAYRSELNEILLKELSIHD